MWRFVNFMGLKSKLLRQTEMGCYRFFTDISVWLFWPLENESDRTMHCLLPVRLLMLLAKKSCSPKPKSEVAHIGFMTTTFLDNEATKADYLSHSKRSLNTHQPSTGPPYSASPPNRLVLSKTTTPFVVCSILATDLLVWALCIFRWQNTQNLNAKEI